MIPESGNKSRNLGKTENRTVILRRVILLLRTIMRDLQHRKWAQAVITRDGCCRWCGETHDLVAHHLWPWAEYPEKRYDVSAGVALCKWLCHKMVFRRENEFREQFLAMGI